MFFPGWSRNHHIHRPKSTIRNKIALMPVQSIQSRTRKNATASPTRCEEGADAALGWGGVSWGQDRPWSDYRCNLVPATMTRVECSAGQKEFRARAGLTVSVGVRFTGKQLVNFARVGARGYQPASPLAPVTVLFRLAAIERCTLDQRGVYSVPAAW
jgi:hypothetical protein